MADETKKPDAPRAEDDADASEQSAAPRTPSPPRTDDKSPSPGSEIENAGSLPAPSPSTETSAAATVTPESQAALTGKAPSGSSTSGTTVPAASGDPATSVPTSEAPATEAQPPGGASPAIGDPVRGASQSDLEKAAKIAEAKARATAAKQAAGDKATASQAAPGATAPGAPKAPVKKKDEGPKPVDAAAHPLVKKLREQFDDALLEATEFIGQLSIRLQATRIAEVCRFLKRDADTPFDFLSDVTCVHFPDRSDGPFEIVYNLYSISANERVRLKVSTSEEAGVESVSSVWPTANWMEREVFDLFGVPFSNHPDLRRILLPPDWEGHPLRKEYPLEFIENNWTAKHLPEFTEVQQEQLVQRRNYGLEILSMPAERRVREIFRAGKEVMTKDK
jgi:NADH-quinone oxidoreductase subunit C